MESRKKLSLTQVEDGIGSGISSIGITEGSLFDITNSPLTSNGEIQFNLKNQSAYTVFARAAVTGIPSFQSLTENHIPALSISKITNLQNILTDLANSTYTPPTQDPINIGPLTGASVISEVTVNNLGHVTAINTRNITPANIGAQPAGSYESLSNKSTITTLGNSDSLYPTQKAVKTYVDNVTSGKLNSNDATVVKTNNAQKITGLKTFVSGAVGVERNVINFDYPDNNGEDYNLRLFNNSENNNVRYYYKQKVILGNNDVTLNFPVLGFQNTITLIGADKYPIGIDPETYYNSQTNPATRHPLVLYTEGQSMFSDRVYVGKQDYTGTTFLGSDDKLYSSGTIYAAKGIRTPDPVTPAILDHTTWMLGDAVAEVQSASTHIIRVSINGVVYKIMALAV